MILVTGGAGYIGSQIVRDLLKNSYKVVVIDNLELGHKEAIPKAENVKFFKASFADKNMLQQIFASFPIEAVIHLAAYSDVSESIKNPEKYFKNNVENSRVLLDQILKAGVKKIIFSSSASICGEPIKIPITENAAISPINPYGQSKAGFEKILSEYSGEKGLKFISLRYFNAAGADLDGAFGEDHNPETHLIPRVLKTALGQLQKVEIFGNDYPTPDKTCVRDYVHIKDLSESHILALTALLGGADSDFYNVGSGNGYSVKQIISEAEKITGKKVPAAIKPRRRGDPAILITDNTKIKKEFGWTPKYSDINTIITTAWKWHKSHLSGYG